MVKLTVEGQSLRLEGRLDIHSVKQAHEALKRLEVTPRLFDVKGLEGLDTAGVQWLFWCAQKVGGALEVAGASKAVAATFKATGFSAWVKS